MSLLIHRLLGDRLLLRSSTPVLIVEGARAVGKTTMVRAQLERERGYHYVTLADAATRERAAADTKEWLRSLPRPAVIDEAQLVPGLPLELKEYVDALGGGNHFVLTGSASIGRTGLGGADPLTRRSQRFTMHPLTRWELAEQPGSLVDALFDAEPRAGRYRQADDAVLLDELRRGGFPGYVFPRFISTRRQLSSRVASDMMAILSDEVAPDFDASITKARAVLDALLRTPGGIFNAARLGQDLELDKRTVERNLSLFGRLFLLQWLPNLATAPRKRDFSRAKVHPFGLSFSVDALERSGANILERREYFGQLLESHVVSEILANAQWAGRGTRAHYWRQASSSNPEVDLVLLDETDRAVAFEVKAASTVSLDDVRGIRAFQRSRDLHRGFIFYRGEEVLSLGEKIWALPFSALGDAGVFREPLHQGDQAAARREPFRAQEHTRAEEIILPSSDKSRENQEVDATLFLSYVHADDEVQKGRIVAFARDLVRTYSFLYGRDLQLFIDRDDLNWGESWRERLSREIDATTFLLAVVTPNYLRSEACRRELLDFSAAARQSREPRLLLPLMWVNVEQTDVVPEDDPVRHRIQESEWHDVTAVRRIEPGSIQYEQLIEGVAARLKKTIDARAQGAVAVSPSTGSGSALTEPGSAETPDLVQLATELSERQEKLQAEAVAFKDALEIVIAEFQAEPIPAGQDPRLAAATFERLGQRLDLPSAELEKATAALGRSWDALDATMTIVAQLTAEAPVEMHRELSETLAAMEHSLVVPGLDQVESMLALLGNVSRHLRPAARALSGSIRLLRGVQDSVGAWRKRF